MCQRVKRNRLISNNLVSGQTLRIGLKLFDHVRMFHNRGSRSALIGTPRKDNLLKDNYTLRPHECPGSRFRANAHAKAPSASSDGSEANGSGNGNANANAASTPDQVVA